METEGRLRATATVGAQTVTDRGTADTAIGFKWAVKEGDNSTPSMALLIHADLDTGSAAFRGQGVRPSVRLVAEWELPGDMSAGVMPGVFQERNEEGKRYTGLILAGVVGKSTAFVRNLPLQVGEGMTGIAGGRVRTRLSTPTAASS